MPFTDVITSNNVQNNTESGTMELPLTLSVGYYFPSLRMGNTGIHVTSFKRVPGQAQCANYQSLFKNIISAHTLERLSML